MPTRPVRVPEQVHQEVQAASRVLGTSASEQLAEAWRLYTETPSFRDKYERAQKAFSVGDLEVVVELISEQQIAKRLAAAADDPES